jgi:DNA-binding PadR family transcriptional regulator
MSTVDLMLLGVLMQRPLNAYEMKKEMERRNIADWIKISSPSVYKNLIKLCKSGLVDGKTVREGEMPEKTIYTINARGKKHFMRLMRKYAEEPEKVYIDFAAFIANLAQVDHKTGIELLGALQQVLVEKRDAVIEQRDALEGISAYGTAIVSLYERMYGVFCEWSEEFAAQYAARP